MSFTVDANVLLYASDEASERNPKALAFLERVAGGEEVVYLLWPAVMAYLRIATHPAIFKRPLKTAEAVANIEQLLALRHVQTCGEQDRFWTSYRRIAAEADVRGNLVPDAHIVALMMECGIRTIWTHDRDFRRFPNIDVRDPFE